MEYTDSKLGYSVTLPEGFEKKEDGLFTSVKGMIVIDVQPIEKGSSVEAQIKEGAEAFKQPDDSIEKIFSLEIKSDSLLYKFLAKDDPNTGNSTRYMAQYVCGKGKHLFELGLMYEKEADFNNEVDAVVASFVVK